MIWKILLAVSVAVNIWLSGYVDMPMWEYIAGMACFIFGATEMLIYERR